MTSYLMFVTVEPMEYPSYRTQFVAYNVHYFLRPSLPAFLLNCT